MKNRTVFEYIFFAVFILSGFLTLLFTKHFFSGEKPSNSLVVAEVLRADNDVRVKYPMQYAWRKLKKGDLIANGATIYTGDKSLASMILVDDTKIEQDENSAMEIVYVVRVVKRRYVDGSVSKLNGIPRKTVGLNLIEGRTLLEKSEKGLVEEVVAGGHHVTFETDAATSVEVSYVDDKKNGEFTVYVDTGDVTVSSDGAQDGVLIEQNKKYEVDDKNNDGKVTQQDESSTSERAQNYVRRQLSADEKLDDFLFKLDRAFSFL